MRAHIATTEGRHRRAAPQIAPLLALFLAVTLILTPAAQGDQAIILDPDDAIRVTSCGTPLVFNLAGRQVDVPTRRVERHRWRVRNDRTQPVEVVADCKWW